MAPLSVKACYKNIKRRFSLDPASTYADFESNLSSIFSLSPPLTIVYKDDEDDLVAVSSDAELSELFAVASSAAITPLRIYLYDSPEELSTAPEEPTRSVPPPQSATPPPPPEPPRAPDAVPQLDTVFSGVSQILSTIFSEGLNPSFRGRRSHPCGWRGRGPRPRRPDMRGGPSAPPQPPPFFNMFSPMASMFAAFANADGGPAQMFSDMSRVSQQTREAFQQASQAVMAVDDPSRVLNAARAGMPVVRAWMRDRLGEEGPVAQDDVNRLVAELENTVGEGMGTEITGRVAELVRVALRDHVVIEVLRQVPDDVSFSWDAEMRPPGWEPLRRSGFSVHTGIECDSCGTLPVQGSRFKATNRANYDLCDRCYNDDTVNKQGIEFKEYKYIWEAQLDDAPVPPAPLVMGNRGVSVAFLQKLLTDLGYMNETMYRRGVGMFGPNTKAAVMQFQREHGLSDVVDAGAYDATTAASLVSIIETQVPPTAAAGGDTAGAGPSSATATTPEPSPAQG